MNDENEVLTKVDIINMMESFQTNIEFNQQLSVRQERLIADQSKVIENLSNITNNQVEVSRDLKDLIRMLTEHNLACNKSITEAAGSIKEIGDKAEITKVENIKDHGILKNHLMVISGGLLAVVIALIVALEKIWSKSDIIDAVANFIGVK